MGGAAPAISGNPFLISVSRIWASRKSPRPVFAECFKDLLHPRCTGDLRRPVFAECFKDLGLPEISAARFCRVFEGFGPPGDLRGPFLQSVSRIWASRRSPRPVFAECFKDLGLPEISAARFCKVLQGFGPPGDLRGPLLMSVSRIWASRKS